MQLQQINPLPKRSYKKHNSETLPQRCSRRLLDFPSLSRGGLGRIGMPLVSGCVSGTPKVKRHLGNTTFGGAISIQAANLRIQPSEVIPINSMTLGICL